MVPAMVLANPRYHHHCPPIGFVAPSILRIWSWKRKVAKRPALRTVIQGWWEGRAVSPDIVPMAPRVIPAEG